MAKKFVIFELDEKLKLDIEKGVKFSKRELLQTLLNFILQISNGFTKKSTTSSSYFRYYSTQYGIGIFMETTFNYAQALSYVAERLKANADHTGPKASHKLDAPSLGNYPKDGIVIYDNDEYEKASREAERNPKIFEDDPSLAAAIHLASQESNLVTSTFEALWGESKGADYFAVDDVILQTLDALDNPKGEIDGEIDTNAVLKRLAKLDDYRQMNAIFNRSLLTVCKDLDLSEKSSDLNFMLKAVNQQMQGCREFLRTDWLEALEKHREDNSL